MVTSCGKSMYPSDWNMLTPVGTDWRWVTQEHKEPGEEMDTITGSPKRICGLLTDHEIMVLLCPDCLVLNGRKW